MSVADEHFALFIPQPVVERFQAGKKRDRFNLLKKRIGFVTFLKIIIGNARTEVMNVMEPDVAGKPLQDTRQLIKGTALEG
jgi:hypothetical protein